MNDTYYIISLSLLRLHWSCVIIITIQSAAQTCVIEFKLLLRRPMCASTAAGLSRTCFYRENHLPTDNTSIARSLQSGNRFETNGGGGGIRVKSACGTRPNDDTIYKTVDEEKIKNKNIPYHA